jgi:hypothetical protein
MSYEGIKEVFAGAGGFYMAPVHFFLQSISVCPPLLYHILTFVIYFVVVIIFYYTLSYLKIEENKRFILTAFFTVIPINAARIYMICFPYTIGILFCFASLYLFTVSYYKRQIVVRIISLILCIISFLFLRSTFVFIPAYIVFIITINEIKTTLSLTAILRKIIVKSLKYADFIIITIGTWIWSSVYMKPTGLYAADQYNAITWKTIALFPVNFIKTVIESFTHLTNFTDELYMIVGFGLLSVLLFILFRKKSVSYTVMEKNEFLFNKRPVKLSTFSFWGLYFLIAGAFAYIAVNKTPEFNNAESRHQILLGAGISLLLLDFLINCINSKYVKPVFIILITFFITSNIDKCLMFHQAKYKQLAFMEEMKKSEEIAGNKNFIFNDNMRYNDLCGMSFYACTGMAKKVFGDETRLIIDKATYNKITAKSVDINAFKKSQYNMKNISFNDTFDYYIIIEPDEINLLKYKNIVRLMIEELFFKEQFARDINKIITVNCVPYKNEQ